MFHASVRPPRLVICLLAASVIAWTPAAAAFSWSAIAEEIAGALQDAVTHQKSGNAKEATRAITRAYFGIFEGRKMEAAMDHALGEDRAHAVEDRFGDLRKAVNGDHDAFAAAAAELTALVRKEAKALEAAGVPEGGGDA